MAAIVVENLSPQAIAELERRARNNRSTIADEVVKILEFSVEWEERAAPEIISSTETSVPFDLPWPEPVYVVRGVPIIGQREPDPGTLPRGDDTR